METKSIGIAARRAWRPNTPKPPALRRTKTKFPTTETTCAVQVKCSSNNHGKDVSTIPPLTAQREEDNASNDYTQMPCLEIGPEHEKLADDSLHFSTGKKKKRKSRRNAKCLEKHSKLYAQAINRVKKTKEEALKAEAKKQKRRLIKSPRSVAQKAVLRQKFISRAKYYIGTPYARKYQSEDIPESPLYLDCCGLIRQILHDLQKDFGFVPGKWNQSYQFDTLPIRVKRVDQLLPGDLIFYAGHYTSKRSKKQRHNLTHVEIFIGGETGEATIGARHLRGTVEIFPSYKFDSNLWTLERHYFCSIDTWLNGECIPRNPFPPTVAKKQPLMEDFARLELGDSKNTTTNDTASAASDNPSPLLDIQNFTLVSVHEEQNPHWRDSMEDVHRIIPRMDIKGERNISYFAVYDGHGGRGTVEYLETALEGYIRDEINSRQNECFDVPEFLRCAYLKCDNSSLDSIKRQSKDSSDEYSGSTAASALLVQGNTLFPKALYIANCGDTRIVLCEEVFEKPGNYITRRLSYDHKPYDEEERARIRKLGGSVKNGRVMKVLSVARSFGDHFLKKYVTAEPFCPDPVIIESAAHCPFFIIACDGLWDVISDEEAVEIVLQRYKKQGPFEGAAKLLVDTAVERDTSDNVTVMVIFV